MKKIVFALLLMIPLSALAQTALPREERNATMKTRDGVTLRANIFRPQGDGPWPVLLQRSPYNKDNDWAEDFVRRATARGFMIVIQDVRGRYQSDGEWYTFKHESEDGYDAVEWAAALPGSNGKVGMFGGSYVGATQMLAAIAHPPHLAGICPVVTASNYHENWTYQGGALTQWFDQSWASGLAQDTLRREAGMNNNALPNAMHLPITELPVTNMTQALDSPELMAKLAPYYIDWLKHPRYDDYWKQWSIEEHWSQISVPALHVAAWYDLFQDGSIRNFTGLQKYAATEAARKGQRLLVVIGGHSGMGRKVGDVDFGADAAFDESEMNIKWYEYILLGKQNEFSSPNPVKIFVMGENKWREEAAWPVPEAKPAKYLLASSGKANNAAGDGVLSLEAAKTAEKDAFVYDPSNPVPTIGGPLCCDANHLAPGPRNQKAAEDRNDVLIYSTPALAKDVEVTGPVTLDVFVSSTAVDTDFTAKLVDVWPDGFAQNLTEGVLRAKYRNSREKEDLLVPGQIYELKIDLWSTSNVFKQGHKIRLEVSSSNFPRFDRNLNTGKIATESKDFVKATNTVYHDAQHPSALILPIVPR